MRTNKIALNMLLARALVASIDKQLSPQTCNISAEEQAERDRPKSRQERRNVERLARKGRKP